jgi:hypothetical protein
MSQDVLIQIETLEAEAAASFGEQSVRLLGEAVLLADQAEIDP